MEQQIKIEGKAYKICGLIGQGASGQVFIGINQQGQQYAIKKVYNYNRQKVRQSINEQVRIQRMFKANKFVIQCEGMTTNEDQNVAFIAFELGECSLRNRLDQRKELMQNDYFKMLIDVSRGLIEIHNLKIMHRDIKPENIILKNGVYKITDFGIAGKKDADLQVAGTLLYWPPQVIFEGEQQFNSVFDIKTDVWSLGVTAFQAYCGINPFFYGKSDSVKYQEAQAQIKKNIKKLTPGFTIQKFVDHIRNLGFKDKANHITLKKSVVKPQLLGLFGMMLEPNPKQRIEMDMVLAFLLSMDGKVVLPPPKVKVLKNDPPFDIAFFINILNIFYEINVELPTYNSSRIEFYLESAIWFIEQANYVKQRYVQKMHQEQIILNAKDHKKLWSKIRECLSEYFYQLKQQKFSFFDRINELRFGILVCSCWNKVIYNDKPFCQKVRNVSQLDVKTLEELLQMAPLYSDKSLRHIEQFVLLNLYT